MGDPIDSLADCETLGADVAAETDKDGTTTLVAIIAESNKGMNFVFLKNIVDLPFYIYFLGE